MLVLNPLLHEHLQPWTLWQDEKAYEEMIVPRVEVGHIGPIPLKFVDHIMHLRRIEDPNSLAAMLRQLMNR
ncbi:hypothetical protein D0A36_19785 [Xanthomonas campestris]|nr:hypothetical protein D0A36_19785 [Xanthomonas campestris]